MNFLVRKGAFENSNSASIRPSVKRRLLNLDILSSLQFLSCITSISSKIENLFENIITSSHANDCI